MVHPVNAAAVAWQMQLEICCPKLLPSESKKKDLESKDKFIDNLVKQMDELLMRKSEIIQRKNEHIESLSEMFSQANAELKSSRAMYADQAIKLNDLKQQIEQFAASICNLPSQQRAA